MPTCFQPFIIESTTEQIIGGGGSDLYRVLLAHIFFKTLPQKYLTVAMINSDDDGGTGDRKQGSDLPCLKGLDSLPCIRSLSALA